MAEDTLEEKRGDEMDWQTFLKWEKASRDTIDFKTIYVDMAGDLVAGLLLSQIIYWHLPDDRGKTKLRVKKVGKWWLAKAHKDWWDEVRIPERTVKRKLNLLKERGLIETGTWRFNGFRMTHIRILWGAFMRAWEVALEAYGPTEEDKTAFEDSMALPVRPKWPDRTGQNGLTESDKMARPLTETTTETTETENTTTTKAAAAEFPSSSSLNSPKERLKQLLSELGIVEPTISELADNPKVTKQLVALWLEPYNRWREKGKGFEGIKNVQGFIVASLRRGNMPFQEPSAASDPYGFDAALEERAALR